MICAIDCETTGLIPGYHDVISIAIIPLDRVTFEPIKEAFVTDVKPMYPDRATEGALACNKRTLESLEGAPDRVDTVRAFNQWFEDNVHPEKIEPLGHNYAGFDKGFLMNWLDPETKVNPNAGGMMEMFFHYKPRDTMIAVQLINDRAKRADVPLPFSRTYLGACCKKLGVELVNAHTAEGDALATAQLYDKLLSL